jgi:exonuclease 3'-5' domain-containing protein 1
MLPVTASYQFASYVRRSRGSKPLPSRIYQHLHPSVDAGGSNSRIYLIDVHTLGAEVFRTPGTEGKTLKDILQDKQIPKVFFDVRNDSDALYAHFYVALQEIEDVQLMESATRKTTQSRRLLSGLKACVENNVFTLIDRSGQTS